MTTPIADSGIAVQAFEFLELRPLSSVSDDSADAEAARQALPEARKLCLSSCDWSAASRTVPLHPVLDGTTGQQLVSPDPALAVICPLPADFLVARRITSGTFDVPYRIDLSLAGALQVLVDAGSDLALRYTADMTIEAQLPPHLRLAVALQLAVLLSDKRTTSASKKDALLRQLDKALARARRYDTPNASPVRYDGGRDVGDWVGEASL